MSTVPNNSASAPTPPGGGVPSAGNFIHDIIDQDLQSNRHGAGQLVITRFPPEPNGYLHIGHAKSICLNFGTALKYGGRCHLRMDDTNPAKEEQEYIDAIQRDVRWLGFDWGKYEYHASDYFQQLYDWAVLFIKAGRAFVCDLSADEMSKTRGSLTAPGTPSPFRDRTVAENLDLFERMKKGEFPDGSRVLRAKIDMASPNLNLRDPALYRILRAEHPRTGTNWCIYPMYDWAHGESDWLEGVTHSICTLEFEDHRPLYDWYVETLIALGAKSPASSYRPRQYEFARLNVTYMMTSKRKLLHLVTDKIVNGWDDPRMPTIAGMRRRGYTPAALRNFCDRIGVAKRSNTIGIELLQHFVREDLNKSARRAMVVMNPLKLVITNYQGDAIDELEAVNNPEDASAGTRKVPFSKTIYIEQEDFREVPPPKYYRLFPGNSVRLRYAYIITCTEVIKDAAGNVVEVHCTYDPTTRGGNAPDNRKVKATIHWVSAERGLNVEVRQFEHLFTREDPEDTKGLAPDKDWRANINPNSLTKVNAIVEPSLAEAKAGEHYQFERTGYFCVDKDSTAGKPVFNSTVSLKDSWGKIEAKAAK